jgi:diguanylate cyclase (GGDEF)-like protein
MRIGGHEPAGVARPRRPGRRPGRVWLRVALIAALTAVDGFKLLNDRFGHAAGDELLCDVATALTRAIRAQDTVARLGGDEFCVLAPETDSPGTAPLATRIARAVQDAAIGVETLRTSIGIAVFPADGTSASSLLHAADERLMTAKRDRQRGRVRRRAA